jgi:hypothetical protein
MNGKECRATRREIDESELNQRLSAQAVAHVDHCASCRDFRAERIGLRELVGSLEPVAAPGDFELRLRARLARERQGPTRQPFIFRLIMGAPAIAAAALVVILAVSLVWFAQRNSQPTPEIAKVPIKEDSPVRPAVPTLNTNETPTALIAVNGREVKPDRSSKSGAGRESNSKPASAADKAVDYGMSPAERIRQIEQRAGEVSLSAPVKPMVVSMQDDRGETRRISLPPISFGAQRLVGSSTPVSFSPNISSNSRSW